MPTPKTGTRSTSPHVPSSVPHGRSSYGTLLLSPTTLAHVSHNKLSQTGPPAPQVHSHLLARTCLQQCGVFLLRRVLIGRIPRLNSTLLLHGGIHLGSSPYHISLATTSLVGGSIDLSRACVMTPPPFVTSRAPILDLFPDTLLPLPTCGQPQSKHRQMPPSLV